MLIKQTKTQVLAEIRKVGKWQGYVVGCNIAPFHIIGGWGLGCLVTFISNGKGEATVENETSCEYNPDTEQYEIVPMGMADWLNNWAYYNTDNERGKYAAFYKLGAK